MPHSSQRSGILKLAMIAVLSTGCSDSWFLKIFPATHENAASIALSNLYPSRVIMANSTFSVTSAIIHSENEKPLWESFQAKFDEKNKQCMLSCRIQRLGSLPTGQFKVSTMSIALHAPDIASASMFLLRPQEDCLPSMEMLNKFSDQGHVYNFAQTIFIHIQPRAIPSLLQKPSIPFRTIYKSFRPRNMLAENRVLNSQLELDHFFDEHPNNGQIPPAESIDFSTEQVIVVSFGEQPTGMIDGKISIIEEQSDRLLVHPVRWLPLSEAFTGDIGYPAHLVVIKRSIKPIEFAPVLDGFPIEAS